MHRVQRSWIRRPSWAPRALLLCTILATIAACSDSTEPVSLAGQYTATTFTTTLGSTTTDVLAAGGSISITLTNSGTTSGRFFVPASLTDGGNFDVSMDGTYTVSDGNVTFNQAADTFVRDMTFTQVGNTLVGSGLFSNTTISVVLTKTAR